MENQVRLHLLEPGLKLMILVFVCCLSIGYWAGMQYLFERTSFSIQGTEESYLGNEDLEDVEVMKFRKSEAEVLTIIHTHMLSLSVIFVLTGLLIYFTELGNGWKVLLMVEPFISLIVIFGGIWFMWNGVTWIKYLMFPLGVLMHVFFVLQIVVIVYNLYVRRIG
ncbi:MAG: hypothetical protein IH948_00995 [Bacteroidetes bacterium]|nr:hypothetical protein [Bacteroidota bacterium]